MQKHNQKLFSNFDGLPLAVTIIAPEKDEKLKGIFQICHGMAEHRNRYIPFMKFLASNGYVCVIHDHRGHRESIKSKEDLGYFYELTANAIVEDAYQITQFIKEQYPTLPVYLLGHSMGSLVVRTYLKKDDQIIDKLIVCGPPAENKAAGIGIWLAKIISYFKGEHYRSPLLQKLAISGYEKKFQEESANSWIVSQKEVVKAYDADEKCGFTFTANGFLNLFTLMKNTYSKKGWKASHLDLPIFFIAGAEDPVIGSPTQFKKAQEFLKKIGYTQIQAKLYPGKRHEILNEDIRQEVYEDILHFLQAY